MERECFEYLDGAFRVLMRLLQSNINTEVVNVLNDENYSVAALGGYLNLNASQQAVSGDAQKPCPICELLLRPDHNFNFCMRCGRDLRTA